MPCVKNLSCSNKANNMYIKSLMIIPHCIFTETQEHFFPFLHSGYLSLDGIVLI